MILRKEKNYWLIHSHMKISKDIHKRNQKESEKKCYKSMQFFPQE